MRISSIFRALTSFCFIVSCIPLALSSPTSSLKKRQKLYCANAPEVVAGTLFANKRSLIQLREDESDHEIFQRDLFSRFPPPDDSDHSPVTWCARGTQTYVQITYTAYFEDRNLHDLLDEAYGSIRHHIETSGDGVIAASVPFVFHEQENGFTFDAYNAGGHQLTYGVLGAAITAIDNCMALSVFGTARFSIFDGPNEVGAGSIGGK